MAGPAASVSGKSWDCWPADDADECSMTSSSGSSSTVSSGTATPIGNPSSPSQTPLLVRRHHPSSSDDVMKLPRKDMKIFGEFPGRDDFLLVLCDTCHRYIKAEAFEAHCRQRHDFVGRQGGGRAAVAAAAAAASTRGKAAQLRSCTVELTKEDLFPLSSSSSSATAETSAATTMVSSPAASLTKEEPMDESNPVMMVNPVSESRTALAPPTPMEEADSTTANNVISIPDTDPLPAMSNELMAMVSGEPVLLPKSEASGPNTPSGVDSTSARVVGGKRGSAAAAAFQISPHSVIKLQINPPPPLPPPPPPVLPTHPNPPSPAANKKASPGKKAGSLLAVGVGGGGAGGGRQDRRALQREYNPDKHCGVWDNESKRHCTRALTCKSHSVLLKRNIQGRSKSFDDLVQEHKAQKEAQQAAAAALAGAAAAAAAGPAPLRTTSRPPPGVLANAESVLSSITEPNPIDPRFSIPTSTNGIRIKSNSSSYVPPVPSGAKMTAVSTNLIGSKKSLLCLSSPPSRESDENVIYTTDHPKPLAVCTFGGRRVGGLLVTDRSQFLTRKVVRVAISAGGFHRIRPASRLNELKFGNNVIRRAGGVVGGVGMPAIPTNARIVTTAPGLQAATANNFLVNYNLTPTAVLQGQALPQQPTAAATASAAAAAAARVMTSVTVATAGAGGTSVSSVAGAPGLSLAPQIGRVAVNLAPLPPNAVLATSGLPPGINIATTSDATFKTELQDFKGGIKFELGRNMKPILPTSSDVGK